LSSTLHFQTDLFRHGHHGSPIGDELVVDNFAGGGGASTGIAHAIGRSVDIAINHDLEAIRLHQKNHPETKHYCENILQVDPLEVCEGRPVGMAWFSPDCTHHSNALGGKPRKKEIRALAWIVLRWAAKVRPRVIFLENVKEFEHWGPLKNGRRIKSRMGETFQRWVQQLRDLGYTVEWKRLSACDYGAPTIRERLFLVARCDGQPIVWPRATHGKADNLKPYRTAAECIDWSLPCPSIFLTKEEAKALGVIRPLSENTMKRIAKGLKRYVLDNPQPFIVAYHTQDAFRGQPVTEPLRTQTVENRFGLVTPYLVGIDNKSSGESAAYGPQEPLRTITTENRFAAIAPVITTVNHGTGDLRAHEATEPLGTVTGKGQHALIAPALIQTGYGERDGQAPRALDIGAPLGTVVAGGTKHALCAAWLAKHYGGVTGHGVEQPLGTVTTVDHHSLVSAFLTKFYGTSFGAPADGPVPAITSQGNHIGEVRAFLMKYYGQGDGQPIDEPVHTVTTKDRFGLVTLAGTDYQIVDIGLRMLQPRELARAQGMPESYILEGTKTAQVAMIGNSVCPPVAEALVRSNYRPQTAAMRETA
jgi:DNA (cytosine-5)-methyltransferase 1